MKKYIIRQVEPEAADLSYYFEDDGLTEAAGDFCYTLFIFSYGYHGRVENALNMEAWKKEQENAADLQDSFERVGPGCMFENYKEAMQYHGLKYSPTFCHKLKTLFNDFDPYDAEHMAAYLSIMTGRKWETMGICGYCQGDYCEAVYCVGFHDEKAVRAYGEVWLGCANEFCVIDLDENGEELDACYGYIVADCQAWRDEDIKALVCSWAGIPVEETQLEMIDGQHTYTKYDYRIA